MITMTDKELIRARCGENQQITDGNYDKTLAVKCVNGTFVGKNRFNKPVPFGKDEGVYEAYHFTKGSFQPVTKDDRGALAVLGEDLSAHEVFYFLTS